MGVFIRGWVSQAVPWRDVHQAERIVTPPADEPVSIQDLKRYLRVMEPDTDDQGLEVMVKAARTKVETDTQRCLLNTTIDLLFDAFPSDRVLLLPRAPLVSVTSVTSYDTAGAATVLATSQYTVDTISTPGRVYLTLDGVWPSDVRLQHAGVIRYVAGYGTDPATVPEELVLAMKELVAHWWEERRIVNTEIGSTVVPIIPYGYKDLISAYRVGVTVA